MNSESDSDKDVKEAGDLNKELKNQSALRKILIDEIEEAQEKHESKLSKKNVNEILELKTEDEIRSKVDQLKANWPEACLEYLKIS